MSQSHNLLWLGYRPSSPNSLGVESVQGSIPTSTYLKGSGGHPRIYPPPSYFTSYQNPWRCNCWSLCPLCRPSTEPLLFVCVFSGGYWPLFWSISFWDKRVYVAINTGTDIVTSETCTRGFLDPKSGTSRSTSWWSRGHREIRRRRRPYIEEQRKWHLWTGEAWLPPPFLIRTRLIWKYNFRSHILSKHASVNADVYKSILQLKHLVDKPCTGEDGLCMDASP